MTKVEQACAEINEILKKYDLSLCDSEGQSRFEAEDGFDSIEHAHRGTTTSRLRHERAAQALRAAAIAAESTEQARERLRTENPKLYEQLFGKGFVVQENRDAVASASPPGDWHADDMTAGHGGYDWKGAR